MPYYRIVIWTKRRKLPFKGIRVIPDTNINLVYNRTWTRAFETYRLDLLDIEVQMLSKQCTVVKDFEKKAGTPAQGNG